MQLKCNTVTVKKVYDQLANYTSKVWIMIN